MPMENTNNAFQLGFTQRNTAKAPTIPPATPTIAPAVCIAPPPVLLTLDAAAAFADDAAAGAAAAAAAAGVPFTAPRLAVDCTPPWTILLASAVELALASVLVALASTATLVALAPHTQWLMDPANMFTQLGAEEALHAMAMGSL
jgi:uncharacterized membrane protein YeiB